jgi:hypothetical protein
MSAVLGKEHVISEVTLGREVRKKESTPLLNHLGLEVTQITASQI